MIRVHLLTEDRTDGGLERMTKSCVQALRAQQGRERLEFTNAKGSVDGAAALLKQCEKYELFRFNYAPRCDHVFYVMDARNAWKLPQLRAIAPEPPLERSLPLLIESVKKGMARMAQGERSQAEWLRISNGFHPHVLVWERESLVLPVTDKLGLGEPVLEAYAERQAYENLSARLRLAGKGKYVKAIHGPQYLARIASDATLRAAVLDSNPSFLALVNELVAL
jgi:hypothetical protein